MAEPATGRAALHCSEALANGRCAYFGPTGTQLVNGVEKSGRKPFSTTKRPPNIITLKLKASSRTQPPLTCAAATGTGAAGANDLDRYSRSCGAHTCREAARAEARGSLMLHNREY